MNSTSESDTGPFLVEPVRSYCQVELKPDLAEMQWESLEEATQSTIEAIKATGRSHVLIDLSQLPTIRSGGVASLVRIWKSLNKRTRQLVVVSDNANVRQVLTTTGLQRLWTIVPNREEAAYKLGVTRSEELEQRELRILALAAFPCALLAALALLMMFRGNHEATHYNAQLTALLLSATSLTVGVLSVFKDSGYRRWLSGLAIVVSLSVLSTLFFEGNPIRLRSLSEPTQEVESE